MGPTRTQTTTFTAILALVLAACAGAAAETDTPTTSPGQVPTTAAEIAATTTTTLPTTTSSPSEATTIPNNPAEIVDLQGVVGRSISSEGWLVEPGRYAETLETVSLQLNITEPLSYFETLMFGRTGTRYELFEVVVLTDFAGIIPADRVAIHPVHGVIVPDYTVALPDDLSDWLESVPQLEVENAGEVVGNDFTARAWDIRVDASQGETFECQFGNCVATFVHGSDGTHVVGDEFQFRVREFKGAGSGVYGFMQSSSASFDDTLAIAEMLFNDLEFNTSG
ncbi:MAG: hypothetical protein U9N56_11220 [Actinomycetota bacterium]|nr:hypothetical protein [Actinomycetota bacterium]